MIVECADCGNTRAQCTCPDHATVKDLRPRCEQPGCKKPCEYRNSLKKRLAGMSPSTYRYCCGHRRLIKLYGEEGADRPIGVPTQSIKGRRRRKKNA